MLFRAVDNAILAPDLTAGQVRRIARTAVLDVVAYGKTYGFDVAGIATAVSEVQRCASDANAAPPPYKSAGTSSGSGFYVSSEGHILTNAHVVAGCASVVISLPASKKESGSILATDARNDLALLLSSRRPQSVPIFRAGIRMGEPVASFGYPLANLLPSSGNFSMGHITATAGLHDDPRHLQISNPVQPGNSGGPLFDMKGNVVGVVASRLTARLPKDVPQNVNFAIKSDVAIGFLDANNVPRARELRDAPHLDPADLAAVASDVSLHIRCVPTGPQ